MIVTFFLNYELHKIVASLICFLKRKGKTHLSVCAYPVFVLNNKLYVYNSKDFSFMRPYQLFLFPFHPEVDRSRKISNRPNFLLSWR